jgi:small subunit ribosomal protein S7
MPRRTKVQHRVVLPDPKFNNRNITRLIGRMMWDGKRSIAEHIIYEALDIIEQRAKRSPIEVFEQALRAATPVIEVKPRRVGGATYQVPVEIRGERKTALAMRWLINSARNRAGGHSMAEKLAAELMDAAAGQGATIRKRDETHKMADSNKAFASYGRF